ncbi:DUF2254 domain-containing protein [Aliidiomarina iranensis]|uniref:DUF2254 domain-containing protein n=1 Tax=Aliidiomarina iranensis TaxID=1434071 RepID=A0A432VZT0_9GAMM|nr:DUF2254 domain-containing protein [Aliidiomarina iranensis]RUO22257.1 DUF2254 domain-containing protein [Aliidiomarina iranensis]
MLNRMYHVWLDVRASFWFLPSIIVLTSVVLAFSLIELEELTAAQFFENWPRAFGSSIDGSRSLLSTIATTTITVTGVVFSSTLVALSLASSQYSSRILRNFMSDKGTQISLGAFLGIFSYCLIVLKTIGGEDAFVPSLAVLMGLLLGFVGIGVFIFFIHHIARSIQANHILAEVAVETICAIENLYPKISQSSDEAKEEQPYSNADIEATLQGTERFWHPIVADKSGYIQSLDTSNLVAFAEKKGGIIRVQERVGEFAVADVEVLSVYGFLPTAEEQKTLANMVAIGRQRTVEQDITFGIRQLVDVALRALSPGINDSTTGIMCIDQLVAIFAVLNKYQVKCAFTGESNELRLLLKGPSYEDLLYSAFDQIRQNARGNVWVLKRLLTALQVIASTTHEHSRLESIRLQLAAVVEVINESDVSKHDRLMLAEAAKDITRVV